jgi:hypothetical protein
LRGGITVWRLLHRTSFRANHLETTDSGSCASPNAKKQVKIKAEAESVCGSVFYRALRILAASPSVPLCKQDAAQPVKRSK